MSFFKIEALSTRSAERATVMWIGEDIPADEGNATDTNGGLAIVLMDERPVLITALMTCSDSLVLEGYEQRLSELWDSEPRRTVSLAEMYAEIDRRCADVITKYISMRFA